MPGREQEVLEIRADGTGRYARYDSGEPGPPLEETTFTLAPAQRKALWTALLDHGFFDLEPRYARAGAVDGAFASLTVTAGDRVHRVEVENVPVPRFESLLQDINRITPEGKDLHFKVPAP
jgi:hypothetical protein